MRRRRFSTSFLRKQESSRTLDPCFRRDGGQGSQTTRLTKSICPGRITCDCPGPGMLRHPRTKKQTARLPIARRNRCAMRYLSAAAGGRGPHPCTPYAGLHSACCRSPRQAPHSVILAPLPTRVKAYCMPREEPRKPAQNTAFSAMFPPSPARPAVKMTELRQTARAGEEYGAARPRPKRRRCHFIAMVSGKRATQK